MLVFNIFIFYTKVMYFSGLPEPVNFHFFGSSSEQVLAPAPAPTLIRKRKKHRHFFNSFITKYEKYMQIVKVP